MTTGNAAVNGLATAPTVPSFLFYGHYFYNNISLISFTNINVMCNKYGPRNSINIRYLTFLTDASAVPEGGSGRFAFTVLSVSAMLVHAYYTSAIVSALMSTGRGGPDSLKALGDSKYAIGSEDYDYMRYLFFDVSYSISSP